MQRRSPFASRGFTLVEMMVVLVILGILAAISVPSLSETFARQQPKEAAVEVASVLRNARDRAMSRGEVVLVGIKPKNWLKLYRSDPSASTSLCSQVEKSKMVSFHTLTLSSAGYANVRIFETYPDGIYDGSSGDPLCFSPDGRLFHIDSGDPKPPSSCKEGVFRLIIAEADWDGSSNPLGSTDIRKCQHDASNKTEHIQGRQAVNLWEIRAAHFGSVRVIQ